MFPTVGRIAGGASVERAVANNFQSEEVLRWNLFQADFLTATRVRDAINAIYPFSTSIEDGVTLALRLPYGADERASVMARIEMLDVDPAQTRAKVIINSRTATVVINSAVRLCARRDQPRQAGRAGGRRSARDPARAVQQGQDRNRRIQRPSASRTAATAW